MPNEEDFFEEKSAGDESSGDNSWDDASEGAGSNKAETKAADAGMSKSGQANNRKSAEFSELTKSEVVSDSKNIDFILDIPLEVTVELGRTSMPIYDLLQLGQGSIVELNKLAGEPLEILVNQKLIAKGEVVVVNEKFGIRLIDVVSTKERVENLR
jgi:flagellar motor switch protein FliN